MTTTTIDLDAIRARADFSADPFHAEDVADLIAEVRRLRAELEQARSDGRRQASADIERMDYQLGDDGWKWLEEKAVGADYPHDAIRRRRTRLDFTTATIEMAYQYGYRTAAKVARGDS